MSDIVERLMGWSYGLANEEADMVIDALTQIERLHAVNAELLAALEWIAEDGATCARATECARAAIAKANETT